MSTMSTNAIERPTTRPGGLAVVPWLTVVPLAVAMAYADGFWMVSLRGAVGSIERTQAPLAAWLRESTLVLPIYVFAVLGALALAAHWFGPALRKAKTVLAAALLIAAAGTLVGSAVLAASSAYDFNLQTSRPMGSMSSLSTPASRASEVQAARGLQFRSVGYGSGFILVTNLVLVGWLVAMRGGRLAVSKTRP